MNPVDEKIIIKMKTAEEENCFHEIQNGGFYHEISFPLAT